MERTGPAVRRHCPKHKRWQGSWPEPLGGDAGGYPADAPRFMITNRGWMYIGQEDWPNDGLLLPMGPRVAILGYLDDPGLPPRPPAL